MSLNVSRGFERLTFVLPYLGQRVTLVQMRTPFGDYVLRAFDGNILVGDIRISAHEAAFSLDLHSISQRAYDVLSIYDRQMYVYELGDVVWC